MDYAKGSSMAIYSLPRQAVSRPSDVTAGASAQRLFACPTRLRAIRAACRAARSFGKLYPTQTDASVGSAKGLPLRGKKPFRADSAHCPQNYHEPRPPNVEIRHSTTARSLTS